MKQTKPTENYPVMINRYDGGAFRMESISTGWIDSLTAYKQIGSKGWRIKGTGLNGRQFLLPMCCNSKLRPAWNRVRKTLPIPVGEQEIALDICQMLP